MAVQRQADGHTDEQVATGNVLKRRGILAAAAAVVAGIVAKQTAQPVAAASLTLENLNTVNGATTTILVAPGFSNTVFEVDATASTSRVLYIDAIRGRGQFEGAGVHGYGGDAKTSTSAGAGLQGDGGNGGTVPGGAIKDGGRGVYAYGGFGGVGGDGVYAHGGGSSTGLRGGYGVYAEAGGGDPTSAVYGINRFNSGAGHVGVTGVCTSAGGFGVEGYIPSTSSVPSTIGVLGLNQSSGAGGAGVRGDCSNGSGVLGVQFTATPGTAGVFGSTAISNGTGLAGQVFGASTTGAAAFVGAAPAGNFAAFFTGDVHITGKLVVSDPSYKSGMLKHAVDGSNRLVYCVESPESWIEDFGTGTLTNGKADVKLDADFAAVVQTGDYHVFLTPRDAACKGLAATTQRADGFVVQELNGGASGGAFAYRIVAKPRTGKKLNRLATYIPPTITLPETPLFDLAPPVPTPATPPAVLPAPAPVPSPRPVGTSAPAAPAVAPAPPAAAPASAPAPVPTGR